MITDKNKFLGILIDCKDEDNNVSISKVMEVSGMSGLQFSRFLEELTEDGVIKYIDTDTYQLNPVAFSVYQSPAKKVRKLAFDFSKFTLKRLTDFTIGVAVGVISTCIAQHFIR